MEKIKFKVAVSINKPLAEVFKAFVDNTIIVNYFTTGASAPIKAAGEKIHWEWGKDNTDILITEYTENKTVSFTWPGYKVDYNTNVRFDFEEKNELPAGYSGKQYESNNTLQRQNILCLCLLFQRRI